MAAFSQQHRPMKISTPLGDDALLLEKLDGAEGMSMLYSFHVVLLAEKAIAFERILGQEVTVEMTSLAGKLRHVSGIVSRFIQDGRVRRGESQLLRFEAELVPHAWLLTRTRQSRVFQHLSVPDILKVVLKNEDVSIRLIDGYPQRNYCVQYEESDFAFVSRLMEEEGIYYFFEHTEKGHTLVLADGLHYPAVADLGGPSVANFSEAEGTARRGDLVTKWRKTQQICPGKVAVAEHHFQLPDSRLNADAMLPSAPVAAGQVSHPLRVAGSDHLELYEPSAGYARFFDGIDKDGGEQPADLQKLFQINQRAARIRLEQEQAGSLVVEGAGDCRSFTPGYTFELHRHFDADGGYLLTHVEHHASFEGSFVSGNESGTFTYKNKFRCVPEKVLYRPTRVTPRPRTDGPLIAEVVGPAGEEIFCDKYGRIKVQFHWDRDGPHDAGSSCWLQVTQNWAGQGFGGLCIPRVGQAVLVDFLHGDPDRPVVVGSLYNAKNMPPYQLPAQATHQGFKTRSRSGTPANFNELRFEDTLGSEGLHLHAEKDMFHSAENSFYIKVGSTFGSGSGGGAGEEGGGESGNGQVLQIEVPKYVGLIEGQSSEIILGLNSEAILGGSFEFIGGFFNLEFVLTPINFEFVLAPNVEYLIGPQFEFVTGPVTEVVTGLVTEVVNGNYVETVNGSFTEVVNGPFFETVNGLFSEIVNGEFLELVDGDFVETVTGQFYEYVGKDFTEIIEGNFTEILFGNFYDQIMGDTIEVGKQHDHDVEQDQAVLLGGTYSMNAVSGLTLQSAGVIKIASEAMIVIACGENKITLSPEGIEIDALNIKLGAMLQATFESLALSQSTQTTTSNEFAMSYLS